MSIKLIKTEEDYDEAIKEIEELMDLDPNPGTEAADRLEVLSALIEKYDNEHFQFDLPDPISAIKFEMEQRNLTQKDLQQFIGSPSKVSEVLNGKRPLSLNMIRNLHEGLGIPAEILLKKPDARIPEKTDIEWTNFPLLEMFKYGYFPNFTESKSMLREYAEELMKPIIYFLVEHCISPVLPNSSISRVPLRSSAYRLRSIRDIDLYHLTAWQAKVVEIAAGDKIDSHYTEPVDEEFMKLIAQLTIYNEGPLHARELLNKHGIHLIIVPHFKKTYLDGAVMFLTDGDPVVGLTLRLDRLDNFWFSLLHELAHLVKHFDDDKSPYFDNFDDKSNDIKDFEIEADKMAEEALIPANKWNGELSNYFDLKGSIEELKHYAKKLHIHESILAGRIQYDNKDYQRFRRLLGNGIPSKLFAQINTKC